MLCMRRCNTPGSPSPGQGDRPHRSLRPAVWISVPPCHRRVRDHAAIPEPPPRIRWQALGSGPPGVFGAEIRADGRRFIASLHRNDHAARGAVGSRPGISILHLMRKGRAQMVMTPVIGMVCFAFIMVDWFGAFAISRACGGLVAIIVGAVLAWGSTVRLKLGRASPFEG